MAMFSNFIQWVVGNPVETLGAATGILYVIFSIRQSLFLWPAAILSSGLYFIVFLRSGLFALMGLQLFYIGISLYGWLHWNRNKNSANQSLPTSRLTDTGWALTVLASALATGLLVLVLHYFANSPLLLWDSISSGISVVASWLLARKKIDHWLLWIVVNGIVIGVSVYQGLWATAVLYMVLLVAAIGGYFQWKKMLAPFNATAQ